MRTSSLTFLFFAVLFAKNLDGIFADMKKGFWASDWFAGITTTIVILLAAYYSEFFPRLELFAYDLGIRYATTAQPDKDIRIIAIDDRSIEQLGPWPWPRNYQARLLDYLAKAPPQTIAFTIPLNEPHQDPGLAAIRESLKMIQDSSMATVDRDIRQLDRLIGRADKRLGARKPKDFSQLKSGFMKSSLRNQLSGDIQQLSHKLQQAESLLDSDTEFASSLQENGRTLLSMTVTRGVHNDQAPTKIPDYLRTSTFTDHGETATAPQSSFPSITSFLAPLPKFALAASGIAYLGATRDIDGTIRTDTLIMSYGDRLIFPSLSLSLAARRDGQDINTISLDDGDSIRIGNQILYKAKTMPVRTRFYPAAGSASAFPIDSFQDVLSGKIPAEQYRDKIVLIGKTATDITMFQATPLSASMAPVLVLAHEVSNILNNDFITRPKWARQAEFTAISIIALYLILLLPRLNIRMGLELSLLLGAILIGTETHLLGHQAIWLQLMLPLSLLISGHLVLLGKRFLLTERARIQTAQELADNNRVLGLGFQEQGKLDMAFDKFRLVPVDPDLMEILYSLGQAYEIKRQFDKAHTVYLYMADFNARFRDLSQRLAHTRENIEIQDHHGKNGGKSSLFLSTGSERKAMLGRYEVEKELGKGAMGMVYQGKDPKIGRKVAIKTLAWSKDLSEDELQSAKARFFREAETAGCLNHPNIVTIYDAGEEHELAYIAMEFITGRNLSDYTRPLNLLPPVITLDLIAKCSDALHYAHELNVVHRDIKPANIMFDLKTKTLKITDFGIARITNSNRTNTGMVLGTPSYMSPEQLAGEKVDGRSDLFSLGVMLFQLLTGRLPFQADTMATLMYKIANEEHLDIKMLRPELPACIAEVVNKLLQKEAANRYTNGKVVAGDIRGCIPQFSQGNMT
jgi:eukaryotic-like serine/threonine-protein kinase